MLQRLVVTPPLPFRPVDGNKGMFGRVLIIGGQATMIGAPALSGRAALVMGSGLVQAATPQEILIAVLTITPELIGLALDHHDDSALLEAADKADVVAIGPGMGQAPESERRLLALLKTDANLVIDADALNLLSKQPQFPKDTRATAVLTPHPGEMKRLCKLLDRPAEVPTDDAGRIELAAAAATAFRQVMVLKGGRTVVTDGTRVYVNHTGDSSLSKAGTGDILTGMTASLIGQKMTPFDAACWRLLNQNTAIWCIIGGKEERPVFFQFSNDHALIVLWRQAWGRRGTNSVNGFVKLLIHLLPLPELEVLGEAKSGLAMHWTMHCLLHQCRGWR